MEDYLSTAKDSSIEMKKAIILLSGGMDSSVLLASQDEEYELFAIIFKYGQKHDKEIDSAICIANHYGIPFEIINISSIAKHLNSSLMKKSDIEIPEHHVQDIPSTYVPFRNTIFLSICAGIAQSKNIDTIFYGANQVDYSGYPDCRPLYVDALNNVLQMHGNIKIRVPIISLTKKEIVELGNKLNIPWKLTWSCYRGGEYPCNNCPSCQYRMKGFKEAGVIDPLVQPNTRYNE